MTVERWPTYKEREFVGQRLGYAAEVWLSERDSPIPWAIAQIDFQSDQPHLVLATLGSGKTLGGGPLVFEQAARLGKKGVSVEPTVAAANNAFSGLRAIYGKMLGETRSLFGLAHLGYSENPYAPFQVITPGVLKGVLTSESIKPQTHVLIVDELHQWQDWSTLYLLANKFPFFIGFSATLNPGNLEEKLGIKTIDIAKEKEVYWHFLREPPEKFLFKKAGKDLSGQWIANMFNDKEKRVGFLKLYAKYGDIVGINRLLILIDSKIQINLWEKQVLRENFTREGKKIPVITFYGGKNPREFENLLAKTEGPVIVLGTIGALQSSVSLPGGLDCVVVAGGKYTREKDPTSGAYRGRNLPLTNNELWQIAGRAKREPGASPPHIFVVAGGISKREAGWVDDKQTLLKREGTLPLEPLGFQPDLEQVMEFLLFKAYLGKNEKKQALVEEKDHPKLFYSARERLVFLGLLTSDERLTDLGRETLNFPLDPERSRLLALVQKEMSPDLYEKFAALLCLGWGNLKDFTETTGKERYDQDYFVFLNKIGILQPTPDIFINLEILKRAEEVERFLKKDLGLKVDQSEIARRRNLYAASMGFKTKKRRVEIPPIDHQEQRYLAEFLLRPDHDLGRECLVVFSPDYYSRESEKYYRLDFRIPNNSYTNKIELYSGESLGIATLLNLPSATAAGTCLSSEAEVTRDKSNRPVLPARILSSHVFGGKYDYYKTKLAIDNLLW